MQIWGVCTLSVRVPLSPSLWFKGTFFPPGNLKVSKQCPGLQRVPLHCHGGPMKQKNVSPALNYSEAENFSALDTCSPWSPQSADL